MKKNVAILVFDDAEVLDFSGPFEVFAVASQVHDHKLFNVFTVAKTQESITAVNGLSVNPNYSIKDTPNIDILIIAGGQGTTPLLKDVEILKWVQEVHKTTALTVSICSGSRILGKLGLLDNKSYCTHHQVYDSMQEIVPTGIPEKEKRFVNSGKIYTSGGISAGIDLSFHIVEKLHGSKITNNTARYMEYNRVD
ncbi:DJ-1/PfpI family protein [Zhouia amylolytica]|uniref:DJ-1/PfpI family protein n=1 Tax=Zhouia amylolytica TaxID=376730 RepID=A0A1I6SGJ1_9FLAO|nr:DJ-1/PfpI family protein [Zhouia amylolytica]MCQ0111669.1 DJ-1/PfpI family protein [Zhouia amylolytica]SFS75868.1 DJ-1/PfpI family protein [Zhouia amylolytica]